VVHQRMRLIVPQFLERNLIPKSALPRFDAAIKSALRLRNSLGVCPRNHFFLDRKQ